MKLVIEPYNYEHAIYCINNNIDAIILGLDKFSLRNTYTFNLNELKEILLIKNKTKVFVKVNSFIFENDIPVLTNYLMELNKLNVDEIIFADYAIAQINDELNLKLKLRYNPETLVTSYLQFPFFVENNFKCVTLTREISKYELKEIINNKNKKLEIEIQGHGYLFIMHSRWELISNFEKYYDLNLPHQQLQIKEELRKLPNLITQDQYGTHMFSGYQIYTLDILDELEGVDWIRIDSINMNEKELYLVTTLYKEVIDFFNNNKLLPNQINDKVSGLKSIASSPISHSFLGKSSDILHMEKENE